MQIVHLTLSDNQYDELAHMAAQEGLPLEDLLPRLLPHAQKPESLASQSLRQLVVSLQQKGVLLKKNLTSVAYDPVAFAQAAEEMGRVVSGSALVSRDRDDA